MSARTWLYERLVGACIDPERVSAELDAHREESIGAAIARLRAIPVTATALTGPVWYGSGWNDAITSLEEIAEYRLPDDEAYPGELQRLRALALAVRVGIRKGSLDEVKRVMDAHVTWEKEATADAAADFFQPGHTYAREHHASTIRFLVRYIDDSPEGIPYQVAFGWRTEDGDVCASPHDEDDFTGWTDVTTVYPVGGENAQETSR